MKRVTRYLDQAEGERPRAKVAVVLVHLGGPEKDADVEAFYKRLWSDPEIVSPPARGFLAGLSSALGRSRRQGPETVSAEAISSWADGGEALQIGHRLVGGRSPVLDLVGSQALALENRLNRRPVMAPSVGGAFQVFHGFRYASPSIDDAVASAAASGAEEVVAIPMYAQRSVSLSGPCLQAVTRAAERESVSRLSVVDPFHDHPRLLTSIGERVQRALDLIPAVHREGAFLVFAAHSPPYARAQKDDYLAEVEAAAQKIMTSVGMDEERSAVAWTSFRGVTRHLTPSVSEFCEGRGKAGHKALVIVPITHLADEYETLHDLDIEAYQSALASGVIQYRRAATLNADPAFIDLLAGLVLAKVPDQARVWARSGDPIRGIRTDGTTS